MVRNAMTYSYWRGVNIVSVLPAATGGEVTALCDSKIPSRAYERFPRGRTDVQRAEAVLQRHGALPVSSASFVARSRGDISRT